MPGKAYRSLQNPKAYEVVKQKLEDKGVPEAEAKTEAAKITNSAAPGHRVTRDKR